MIKVALTGLPQLTSTIAWRYRSNTLQKREQEDGMVLTLMHFSHVACFSFQSDRSSNIEAPNLSSKQRAERNGPGLQKGSIYPPYFPELALKVGYI